MAPESLTDDRPIEDKALSTDDVVNLLGEEDVKLDEEIIPDVEEDLLKPAKEDKKADKKEDDKDDEEEIPEKIELDDEDDLKFEEVPRRKEILAKFPDLFKTFPGMEKALYRENKYSEIFPTIPEAQEARERAEDLSKFESKLLGGSIEEVLQSVKGADEKAFGKIADNILPTLYKVDQNAYYATINQVLKNGLVSAAKSAHESKDEQLFLAAQIIHKFFYQTDKISGPTKYSNAEPENEKVTLEQQKLQTERESFNRERLNIAVNDVQTRVDNILKSNIDRYIDTRGVMSSYVKNKAIAQVLEELQDAMRTDSRFQVIKDRLWIKASQNGFNEASKIEIRNANLSKAKTILPGIIRKVKAEALTSSGRVKKDDSDRKEDRLSTSPRKSAERDREDKPQLKKKTLSTYDFLNQD